MLHTLRLVELVYIALELVKRHLVEPKEPYDLTGKLLMMVTFATI